MPAHSLPDRELEVGGVPMHARWREADDDEKEREYSSMENFLFFSDARALSKIEEFFISNVFLGSQFTRTLTQMEGL